MNIKNDFNKKRLDEKLRIIFVALMTMLMLVISIVFLLVSYRSSREQMGDLARAQVNTLEDMCSYWLTDIRSIAVSAVLDESVQAYCAENTQEGSKAYSYMLQDQVKQTLNAALNMNEDMYFFAVVHDDACEDFVYRGDFSLKHTAFQEAYHSALLQARPAQKRGALRYIYVPDFASREEGVFLMLHPVFSLDRVFQENGMLVICMNGRLFKNGVEDAQSMMQNNMLMDLEGRIVVSSDAVSDDFLPLDFKGQDEGCIRRGMHDYYFRRVPGWNFYVVSEIRHMELMVPVFQNLLLLIGVSLVMLTLAIAFTRYIISRNYKPLEIVVDAMKHVQQGNVAYRVCIDDAGEDFRALESGYNDMMDTIERLFDRIREEQHQAEQIKFNALQSQIQPHFLYNTLDCIHWQALEDGDTRTSQLVQELANYYRICLSKGREIIPLSQELEHIRLYLSIQQQRYGNIIAYQVDVPDELLDIQIPKLTLQPLVENSIYHGIRVKEGLKGEISVRAYACEDGVRIVESDNGLGMNDADIDAMNASISDYSRDLGYGVRNVNRRIELYFGQEYGLQYSRNPSGGLITTVFLPKKHVKPEGVTGKDAYV